MNPLPFKLKILLTIALLSTFAAAMPAWCAGLPKRGDTLPVFELQAPVADKAREYLGVGKARFRLTDIPCRLLLLEVIGYRSPAQVGHRSRKRDPERAYGPRGTGQRAEHRATCLT